MNSSKVWHYADFEVGHEFVTEHELTADQVAEYFRIQGYQSPIFHDETAAHAAGFRGIPVPPVYATTYQFIAAVPGIRLPPGGVYAKQEFKIQAPCYVGDRLRTVISVHDKYERRGRRYIVFDAQSTNQNGEQVIWGRRTRIWPS